MRYRNLVQGAAGYELEGEIQQQLEESQNHAILCIADLQVRNMSQSAAGYVSQLGNNIRAKSGLNKAILDQG